MRVTYMPQLPLIAAVILALSTQLGAAQPASGQCAGVSPADMLAPTSVARIAPGQKRVNFVRSTEADRNACPSDAPACRDTAYLVTGDVVLTSGKTQNGFECASFVDRRGRETSGWLPSSALVPVKPAAISQSDWLGTWRRTEASIKIIRARGGKGLSVEGEATYGALDKSRVARGAVNMGEFDGIARRSGDTAFVAPGDIPSFDKAPKDRCAVRMRRVGPYLIVEDNAACGGANVSFTGLYIKR